MSEIYVVSQRSATDPGAHGLPYYSFRDEATAREWCETVGAEPAASWSVVRVPIYPEPAKAPWHRPGWKA